MKLFKFPKVLKPRGSSTTTSSKTLASRCSAALQKPNRKRMDSGSTLETAQCLSDKSLNVFPLEEHSNTTVGSQQDDELNALAILQRNQVVTLFPTLGLVVPAAPVMSARPVHPHRRSLSMCQTDYDDLLYKSRGWRFDPSSTSSRTLLSDVEDAIQEPRKHRHDRERNLALSDYDFEKFIFKAKGPRLGHH